MLIFRKIAYSSIFRGSQRTTNAAASFKCSQQSLHRATPLLASLSPAGSPHQLSAFRLRSNRSRRGLYDGKDVRTGNKVSFSMNTTKRKFKPNVFKKRVYSEILDEMVRFHLTASALRSIDVAGGLDAYLLRSKHVTEGEGLAVKKRIVKELKRRQREKEIYNETATDDQT